MSVARGGRGQVPRQREDLTADLSLALGGDASALVGEGDEDGPAATVRAGRVWTATAEPGRRVVP
nr:hypothetical protein GCM10020063_031820 [Dactylosporangium thailandense]